MYDKYQMMYDLM